MTDANRLHEMIAELSRMREQCEPEPEAPRGTPWYSNAVSALRWIIDDLAKENRA